MNSQEGYLVSSTENTSFSQRPDPKHYCWIRCLRQSEAKYPRRQPPHHRTKHDTLHGGRRLCPAHGAQRPHRRQRGDRGNPRCWAGSGLREQVFCGCHAAITNDDGHTHHHGVACHATNGDKWLQATFAATKQQATKYCHGSQQSDVTHLQVSWNSGTVLV